MTFKAFILIMVLLSVQAEISQQRAPVRRIRPDKVTFECVRCGWENTGYIYEFADTTRNKTNFESN